jgi:hypothetical protein
VFNELLQLISDSMEWDRTSLIKSMGNAPAPRIVRAFSNWRGIDNQKFGHDCPTTLPHQRNMGCGQTLGLHGFITGKSIAFKFIEKYHFNFIDSTALLF